MEILLPVGIQLMWLIFQGL